MRLRNGQETVYNGLTVSGSTSLTGSLSLSGSVNVDGNITTTGNSNTIGSTTTSTTLTLRGSNVVSFVISDVLNSRSFQLYKNAGSGYIIENNSANKLSYGYAGNYWMSWHSSLKAIALSSTTSEPTPDNSSILDLQSTTKGFLSTRMTAAQRTAISSPAQGLQVYDTGSATEGIWYYNSGSLKSWTRVLNDSGSQTITGNLTVSGSTQLTGSLGVTGSVNVRSIADTISGSTLTVYGSGSSQPVFTVQGSQGELFSVNDSLSGSLFSVNDISGLPVLEAFSDNRVLIGSYQAPALYTTVKVSSVAGNNVIYQNLPTASYDGVFVSYTARSGSNVKVGQLTGMWSASAVLFTEFGTSSFGDTTGLGFTMIVTGGNMAVTASTTTANWNIKTIIRSV
jgi:cytoskeletal protein CcmA (bactofilin family)